MCRVELLRDGHERDATFLERLQDPGKFEIFFGDIGFTASINKNIIPRLVSVGLCSVAIIPFVGCFAGSIRVKYHPVIIIMFMMNHMPYFVFIFHDLLLIKRLSKQL